MRGYLSFGIIAVLVVGVGLGVVGTTVGIAVGVDPTGIYMFSAIAELPIGANIDLSADSCREEAKVPGCQKKTECTQYCNKSPGHCQG